MNSSRFSPSAAFVIGGLFLSCLGLVSCLKGNPKPRPLDSRSPIALKRSELQLSIPLGTLGQQRAEAQSLEATVYEVVDGVRAESVSKPYAFDISTDDTYVLSFSPSGTVDIVAMVYDLQGNLIAQGESRVALRAEGQSLPSIIVFPMGQDLALLDLRLELIARGVQSIEATEPTAVRQALKSANCLGCHSQRAAQGGLVLEVYPYSSNNSLLKAGGSVAILSSAVQRMRSLQNPMPPKPFPAAKDAQITPLETFLSTLSGLDLEGQGPAKVQFELSINTQTKIRLPLVRSGEGYTLEFMPALPLGQLFTYSLQAIDAKGSRLLDVPNAYFTMPETGKVSLNYLYVSPLETRYRRRY